MKTISIVNLKGGVGKTITTLNMAAVLAGDYGKRVLVIDADPQANTSAFLGCGGYDNNTVAGILAGEADYVYEFIYGTPMKNVSCVPSDISLIERDIASVRQGGNIRALAGFLEAIEEDNIVSVEEGEGTVFDFCLIDCPPSFTAASVAAIAASDEVIIPVKVDAFSVSGTKELLAQVKGVSQIRPGITVAGVLITVWHNTPAVVQGEELLRKSVIPVFETHIRRSDKVDESTFARQSLNQYSKTSSAARDYRRFVAEYLGRAE